ncbi:hypothetical protein FQA47_012605 [Oryzias melastigma]|uniref:Uncharacterized protein n=1 Tax=Oryzias melastigma TaxID=30732 RepID=A0A834BX88_ORYME|nr:hypothetical protein FQA47_012605 [Oryzias melastigma]
MEELEEMEEEVQQEFLRIPKQRTDFRKTPLILIRSLVHGGGLILVRAPLTPFIQLLHRTFPNQARFKGSAHLRSAHPACAHSWIWLFKVPQERMPVDQLHLRVRARALKRP